MGGWDEMDGRVNRWMEGVMGGWVGDGWRE